MKAINCVTLALTVLICSTKVLAASELDGTFENTISDQPILSEYNNNLGEVDNSGSKDLTRYCREVAQSKKIHHLFQKDPLFHLQ